MKPVAHVLNLDRRPDRWQRTQELWSPFFELVRVPAVDMSHNGALGCKLSHVQLAERILADEPMVVVLEDDSVPTPEMATIGMECIEQAQWHVPDAINLSPLLDLSAIGFPRAELFPAESPLFLRCSYSHSTNFTIYNHHSLALLHKSLKSPLPIDMYLGLICKSQWVPVKLLATQSFEDSDIRRPFEWQKSAYERSAEMLKQFTPETESCDSKASTQ